MKYDFALDGYCAICLNKYLAIYHTTLATKITSKWTALIMTKLISNRMHCYSRKLSCAKFEFIAKLNMLGLIKNTNIYIKHVNILTLRTCIMHYCLLSMILSGDFNMLADECLTSLTQEIFTNISLLKDVYIQLKFIQLFTLYSNKDCKL